MVFRRRLTNQTGQTLIELLLAIGLMAVILPALFIGLMTARSGKVQQRQRLQATAVLKEAEEAVRSVREKGWSTFAVDGIFHPVISSSSWTLASGSATSNGFTTSLVISDVYRDSSGTITSSGGTLDPSTKKLLTTVSWGTPFTSSITSTTYLTRYMDNLSYTQSSQADFNAGVLTNTSTTNTSDGEVILGAGGGGGDWCQPSKSITTYDLPKNGVANAVVSIEGSVFAGQGNNASGVAFQRVNLTTNQNPPIASNGGALTAGNPVKTNGIYADSQYAYITTDSSHSQVIILDMTQYTDPPTNSNFKQVGTIDLGTGSVKGVSAFVSGSYAYITANDGKLYIYDVTNKASPILKNTGGYQIGSSSPTVGNRILVAGNYAYIATSSTTNAMRIVNIINKTAPTSAGALTLGTGQSGIDLYVNTSLASPSRAYLVTSVVSGKKDFYIVNVENPTTPKLTNSSGTALGQYDTNGMTPTGVTVVTGNRAIVVGTGGTQQYQVINISNETGSLSSCAGLSYSTGVFGVSSVLQSNGYAYSYIITGDSTAELKIILGGAGGQYSSAGTFVSSPFDVATVGLTSTAFNRFTATFTQPPQTTIGFQVAVAAAVNNSCTNANYTFIGPNKTSLSSDLFSSSSGIPLFTSGNYQNPGRCFKYKAYFTSSDVTKTPELDDFTVNYSP